MRTSRLARATAASFLLAAIPVSQINAVASPPAATVPPVSYPAVSPSVSPSASPSIAVNAQHLVNLKTRGAAEINRRVMSLGAALTAINANTKLAATDKSALAAQVQTESTALKALSTKLAADSTVTAALADVQSIISEYRVYALLLPKVRLVASADRFAVVESKLTTFAATLQVQVTAQKAAGKNVTTIQQQLTDMTTQTAAATAKSTSVVAPLLALQSTDYNTDHTVLTTYRATLATALTQLTAARNDAQTIVKALDAL
jgi:hypothetical protein